MQRTVAAVTLGVVTNLAIGVCCAHAQAVSTTVVNQAAAGFPDRVKAELREGGNPGLITSLSGITATVEADRMQAITSGGITVDFEVTNHGHKIVSLLNPYDLITPMVLNKEGWPVTLPQPPSKLEINTPVQYHARMPFAVVRISQDGVEVAEKEWEKEKIQIAPGGHYRITLQFREILADPNTSPAPASPPKKIPISPGQYRIRFSVLLISRSGERAHTVLESDPISVNLHPK